MPGELSPDGIVLELHRISGTHPSEGAEDYPAVSYRDGSGWKTVRLALPTGWVDFVGPGSSPPNRESILKDGDVIERLNVVRGACANFCSFLWRRRPNGTYSGAVRLVPPGIKRGDVDSATSIGHQVVVAGHVGDFSKPSSTFVWAPGATISGVKDIRTTLDPSSDFIEDIGPTAYLCGTVLGHANAVKCISVMLRHEGRVETGERVSRLNWRASHGTLLMRSGAHGRLELVSTPGGSGGSLPINVSSTLIRDEHRAKLTALIPNRSGWSSLSARFINAAGQIAGVGRLHGHTRSFLMSPRYWPQLVAPGAVSIRGSYIDIVQTPRGFKSYWIRPFTNRSHPLIKRMTWQMNNAPRPSYSECDLSPGFDLHITYSDGSVIRAWAGCGDVGARGVAYETHSLAIILARMVQEYTGSPGICRQHWKGHLFRLC